MVVEGGKNETMLRVNMFQYESRAYVSSDTHKAAVTPIATSTKRRYNVE